MSVAISAFISKKEMFCLSYTSLVIWWYFLDERKSWCVSLVSFLVVNINLSILYKDTFPWEELPTGILRQIRDTLLLGQPVGMPVLASVSSGKGQSCYTSVNSFIMMWHSTFSPRMEQKVFRFTQSDCVLHPAAEDRRVEIAGIPEEGSTQNSLCNHWPQLVALGAVSTLLVSPHHKSSSEKKLQLLRYKCEFWFCGCLQKMKL